MLDGVFFPLKLCREDDAIATLGKKSLLLEIIVAHAPNKIQLKLEEVELMQIFGCFIASKASAVFVLFGSIALDITKVRFPHEGCVILVALLCGWKSWAQILVVVLV